MPEPENTEAGGGVGETESSLKSTPGSDVDTGTETPVETGLTREPTEGTPSGEPKQPPAEGAEAPAGTESPAAPKPEGPPKPDLSALLNREYTRLMGEVEESGADKPFYLRRVPDPVVQEQDGKWVARWKLPNLDGTEGYEERTQTFSHRPDDETVQGWFGAELARRRGDLNQKLGERETKPEPKLPETAGDLGFDTFGFGQFGPSAAGGPGPEKPQPEAQQTGPSSHRERWENDAWRTVLSENMQAIHQSIEQQIDDEEKDEPLSPVKRRARGKELLSEAMRGFSNDPDVKRRVRAERQRIEEEYRERLGQDAWEASQQFPGKEHLIREALAVHDSLIRGLPLRSQAQITMARALANPIVGMVYAMEALAFGKRLADARRETLEKAHGAFQSVLKTGAQPATPKQSEAARMAVETNVGAPAGSTPGSGMQAAAAAAVRSEPTDRQIMDSYYDHITKQAVGPRR